MTLDNTLWKQAFPSVTCDAYSSIIVVQIVTRFIKKCNLLPQGTPGTVYSFEVGGVCDSARGKSYVEEVLHPVHAASDGGDKLWNYW